MPGKICVILSIVHFILLKAFSLSRCNLGNWDWEPLEWYKYEPHGDLCPTYGQTMLQNAEGIEEIGFQI